eukprot:TRINITY_DN108006_c0_g1_i1.p1 TRINITY_DN108006_c0_g1~~TRINITY_DN108006_c0_g1_i1.p1  ORF type:complete len:421 (+),score=97.80 TRINITY_DN108006_c0_g1_i1:101-1363(+)
MLRWAGDYSLQRLRAKLATGGTGTERAEPEYAEVYRPALGQSSILRKDCPEFYAALAETGGFDALSRSGSLTGFGKGTNSLSSTSLPSATTRTTGFYATARSSGAFGQTFGRTGSSAFDRTQMGMSGMSRTSSVPSLGTRRVEKSPACLQPLPPNWGSSSTSSLATQASKPAIVIPPAPGSDEAKALEKEKQITSACKQLWVYAHGSVHHVKEEVEVKESEGVTNNQALLKDLAKFDCKGMKKALKAGAKIDWRNPEWDGATLLLKQVRAGGYGALEMAKFCLALGADVNSMDDSDRGVLHWAAVLGDSRAMLYFLTEYPDLQVSAPDSGGDSPLHLAAHGGHLGVVRLLIRHGAKEFENHSGFLPSQLAEARRMWHVVAYMQEQQAEEAEKETVNLRELVLSRPCNIAKADELDAIAEG